MNNTRLTCQLLSRRRINIGITLVYIPDIVQGALLSR